VQLAAGALKSLPNFYLTVELDFALPVHSMCASDASADVAQNVAVDATEVPPASMKASREAGQEKYHPLRQRQPQTPLPAAVEHKTVNQEQTLSTEYFQ
jgi:hypothetical protein